MQFWNVYAMYPTNTEVPLEDVEIGMIVVSAILLAIVALGGLVHCSRNSGFGENLDE